MPRWKVTKTHTTVEEGVIYVDAPTEQAALESEEVQDEDWLDMDIIDGSTDFTISLETAETEPHEAEGTGTCVLCGTSTFWTGWQRPVTCAQYVEYLGFVPSGETSTLYVREEDEPGTFMVAVQEQDHKHTVTVPGPWVHTDQARNTPERQERYEEAMRRG